MISRKQHLVTRIRAVWSQDPALDTEREGFAEAWEKYQQLADPSGLPVKAGEKLTVFDCNPMTREAWLRTSGLSLRELADLVISYSLQQLENYEGQDGRERKLGDSDFDREGGVRHLKRSVLDELYDPGIWDEVATLVHKHSRLDPTRGQG